MATSQFGSSQVKWVKDVKDETRKLLGEFNQEGKERAAFVRQNASAVKLFLNESEKDRLSTNQTSMVAIKSRLQHIRQEEKEIIKNAHDLIKNAQDLMRRIAGENKEFAGGVKRFLIHSETERLADYKKMMEGLRQSIRELQEETAEIRRESVKLLKQLSGEGGALKTEIKKFLRDSEEARIRDFKKMINEVKAVIGETQAYETEEKRLARATALAGTGTKKVSGDVGKKKEITPEAKSEGKATDDGRLKVEAERKKVMLACGKCGTRHWPFQKCQQEKSSFKKEKIA